MTTDSPVGARGASLASPSSAQEEMVYPPRKIELPQRGGRIGGHAGRCFINPDVRRDMGSTHEQRRRFGKDDAPQHERDIGPYWTGAAKIIQSTPAFIPVDMRGGAAVTHARIHKRTGLGRVGANLVRSYAGMSHHMKSQRRRDLGPAFRAKPGFFSAGRQLSAVRQDAVLELLIG